MARAEHGFFKAVSIKEADHSPIAGRGVAQALENPLALLPEFLPKLEHGEQALDVLVNKH